MGATPAMAKENQTSENSAQEGADEDHNVVVMSLEVPPAAWM